MHRFAKGLPARFREKLHFLHGMLKHPGRVGAVAPSGKQLARAMAAQVPLDGALPVLELGPGTGSITSALLERLQDPSRLVLVEYDAGFHTRLAALYPGVTIRRGDAFDLDCTLGPGCPRLYGAIVSGLPLLNFPPAMRAKLLRDCFALLDDGGVFIQFSYGLKPPVRPVSGLYAVKTGGWMARNVPPARVHVYSRCPQPLLGDAP